MDENEITTSGSREEDTAIRALLSAIKEYQFTEEDLIRCMSHEFDYMDED